MTASAPNRLQDIPTSWTLVRSANASQDTSAADARHSLIDRYCGAAWRYLLAVTRSELIADELYQEFALRVLRGDFRKADPEKGRFRNYLKTILINLVNDHHRRSRCRDGTLPQDLPARPHIESEPEFDDSWRAELLDRTWNALRRLNTVSYAALRTHVENEHATAGEKGKVLFSLLGEEFTANRFRVALHRARQQFSRALIQEVAESLESPTEQELQQELRQLRFWRYCKPSK